MDWYEKFANKNKSPKENLMFLIERDSKNDWGKWADIIQDIASGLPTMTTEHWNEIYEHMKADIDACEDQDGTLINGTYYDWRQYGMYRNDILRSFLDYFDDETIKGVFNQLINLAKKS